LRLRARRLPSGSLPLRDISPWSPLFDEHPGSPSFRPQRFSRSRRFAPPRSLQAYFIPLPRPGFRFRGFLPRTSRLTSSVLRLLSPLASSSYRWQATSASSRRVDLRILIQLEIRNHRGGVSPADDPYPLVRPCSYGLCFGNLGDGVSTTSARDLFVRRSLCSVR